MGGMNIDTRGYNGWKKAHRPRRAQEVDAHINLIRGKSITELSKHHTGVRDRVSITRRGRGMSSIVVSPPTDL